MIRPNACQRRSKPSHAGFIEKLVAHLREESPILDISISRCILRGSEFGALHANFIEADTHAHNVAPARELTVAGSALPEADWPLCASRRH
jgi:hypothetical protein